MDQTKAEELRTIAQGIATALGPDWSVQTELGDDWRAFLIGGQGLRLFVSNTWAGQGKLSISGCFPERTQYKRAEINVSASRTPEAIAKDIERRLLPTYKVELAKAHEQDRETKEREEGTKRTIHELSALLGRPDHHFHYAGIATIEVTDPDELDVKLRNLSFETFRQIREKFPSLFTERNDA